MMQSAIYREILAEGELIGEQRGEQRGEQHGRLAVIERQLKRRLGVIPKRGQEKLNTLTLSELDELSEALLDFQSTEDLLRWLKSPRA